MSSKIQDHFAKEEVYVSRKSLCLLLTKVSHDWIAHVQTPHVRRKLTDVHYWFADECMAENDKLTALTLHTKLKERFLN